LATFATFQSLELIGTSAGNPKKWHYFLGVTLRVSRRFWQQNHSIEAMAREERDKWCLGGHRYLRKIWRWVKPINVGKIQQ